MDGPRLLGFAQIASMCHLWLMVFISLFVLNRGAYKVLKVGAADVTDREKSTLENFATAASHTEDPGIICVRQPERIFSHFVEERAYNCFVFEPLGPNLLEFTKRNRPFGSERARKAATYILLGLRSLHATGFVHTGKQRCLPRVRISSINTKQT